MSENDLANLLAPYKEADAPESAVILLDDRDAQKLVAYWPNDHTEWRRPSLKPPLGRAEFWQWLWQGMLVNYANLSLCAGLAQNTTHQKMALVQANRLIFPDHTISKWASKILQAEVQLKYSTRKR